MLLCQLEVQVSDHIFIQSHHCTTYHSYSSMQFFLIIFIFRPHSLHFIILFSIFFFCIHFISFRCFFPSTSSFTFLAKLGILKHQFRYPSTGLQCTLVGFVSVTANFLRRKDVTCSSSRPQYGLQCMMGNDVRSCRHY